MRNSHIVIFISLIVFCLLLLVGGLGLSISMLESRKAKGGMKKTLALIEHREEVLIRQKDVLDQLETNDSLSTGLALSELRNQLTAIADSHHLQLIALPEASSNTEGGLWQVSMSVSGDYINLIKYVFEVEQRRRLGKVVSCKIEQGKLEFGIGNDPLIMRLRLVFFDLG